MAVKSEGREQIDRSRICFYRVQERDVAVFAVVSVEAERFRGKSCIERYAVIAVPAAVVSNLFSRRLDSGECVRGVNSRRLTGGLMRFVVKRRSRGKVFFRHCRYTRLRKRRNLNKVVKRAARVKLNEIVSILYKVLDLSAYCDCISDSNNFHAFAGFDSGAVF